PTQDQAMAFQQQYHVFPKMGYLASGADDDGRWEALECGTKMCVAGWACQLKGYLPSVKMVTVEENGNTIQRPKFDWNQVTKLKRWKNRHTSRHTTHDVAEVARKLLGINEDESDILFHGDYEWTGNDLRAFGKGEKIDYEGKEM
ncbi:uncharacterized protein METZ01_LOCUS444757, partial [marine metagenome]